MVQKFPREKNRGQKIRKDRKNQKSAILVVTRVQRKKKIQGKKSEWNRGKRRKIRNRAKKSEKSEKKYRLHFRRPCVVFQVRKDGTLKYQGPVSFFLPSTQYGDKFV